MSEAILQERFADWSSTVELDSSSERYAALLAASESVGGRLKPTSALALVAYAFGQKGDEVFEQVRDAVRELDPAFAAAPLDLEPRLVASAGVAHALDSEDEMAAVAAEAVLSAKFAGFQAPVGELPDLARRTIAARFASLRERVKVPAFRVENLFKNVPDLASVAGLSGAQAQPLVDAAKALGDKVQTAMTTLNERFETRLDAADEELDVLWWSFGGRSVATGTPWSDLDAPEAVLRSGVELAERHCFEAEIPSAGQILQRVLGTVGQGRYSLDVVVAAPAEGIEFPEVDPAPLLPILTSHREFVAFEGKDGWTTSAGRYGVDPSILREGHEIATQILREILLARALDE